MVNAMQQPGLADEEEDPPKHAAVDLQLLQGNSLANFTTQNSRMLMKKLKLPDGFL